MEGVGGGKEEYNVSLFGWIKITSVCHLQDKKIQIFNIRFALEDYQRNL